MSKDELHEHCIESLDEYFPKESPRTRLKQKVKANFAEYKERWLKMSPSDLIDQYYAQTIAEYLIDEGTDKTHSGNYHFSFTEVNERFGTSLPSDREMLEKIVSSLDSEIVADVDTSEDFDLTFYLDYCPYAEDTEELNDTPTQQM
ncbi:hypothetical protein [Hominenteromicrobium sp.]|uniref:hypothetical protein n=1 Tax=Hominenteromicrobium sp. TaxID=3073581 RepID=UPI003A93E614